MKKMILLGLSITLLAACKVEMSTQIPYSKLFDKNIEVAKSSLLVEVASCTHYEDSRKPSDTLMEARGTIADLFPDAEFNECNTQKFNSYAKFSLPIAYGAVEALKPEHPKVRVLSYNNKVAFVDVAPSLKKKLEGYQNKKYSLSGFKPSEMSIILSVKNDTDSDQKIDLASVYVDDYPVISAQGYDFKKGSTINLTLSNISAETVFLPSDHKQMAYFMVKTDN